MSDDDRSFYERRAAAELELAQKAQHPNAMKAHYALADLYLDLLRGEGDTGSEREAAE